MAGRPWEADASAKFVRRLGKSPLELGNTNADSTCPDLWELDSGDFAVIGRDLTREYARRLPSGVSIGHNERLVVIPRNMLVAAKMISLMLERIAEIPGVPLNSEEYLTDFWPRFRVINDVFWKLERIQEFQEADEPSWVTMKRWSGSVL